MPKRRPGRRELENLEGERRVYKLRLDSQHTPMTLLEAKGDQGISAAGKQRLVQVMFIEDAIRDLDRGEAQRQGGQGLENEGF